MSWIYYSSTSAFWPTYMNPANGALVPPTTTYAVTYMDPNNGAIYPSVTSSRSSSSISAMGIQATGEAVSSVMSDLYHGTASPNATASASSSYVMESTNEDPSASTTDINADSSPSTNDTSTPSPLKIVTAAVPAVIGLVLLVAGIWLCCRCKRRRRSRRDERDQRGRGQYGEMSEVERGGIGGPAMSTTSLGPARTITRAELEGVVSPRTHWQQQQRHLHPDHLTYPSPAAYTLPAPPRTQAGSSSRHSRWTDDSEYDVMAEDGSTITRTLSTTSTRRTIGPDDHDAILPPSSHAATGENPFDHPAYTYRAAPQRAVSQRTYPSSASYTHGGSTLSPISPATPQAHAQMQTQRTIEADAYSVHSSEDGIFGPSAAARPSATVQGRPGLRRDPTIIRHAASFSAGPGRYSTKIERTGRDDAGVVELPPLYEDATSSWTR